MGQVRQTQNGLAAAYFWVGRLPLYTTFAVVPCAAPPSAVCSFAHAGEPSRMPPGALVPPHVAIAAGYYPKSRSLHHCRTVSLPLATCRPGFADSGLVAMLGHQHIRFLQINFPGSLDSPVRSVEVTSTQTQLMPSHYHLIISSHLVPAHLGSSHCLNTDNHASFAASASNRPDAPYIRTCASRTLHIRARSLSLDLLASRYRTV